MPKAFGRNLEMLTKSLSDYILIFYLAKNQSGILKVNNYMTIA